MAGQSDLILENPVEALVQDTYTSELIPDTLRLLEEKLRNSRSENSPLNTLEKCLYWSFRGWQLMQCDWYILAVTPLLITMYLFPSPYSFPSNTLCFGSNVTSQYVTLNLRDRKTQFTVSVSGQDLCQSCNFWETADSEDMNRVWKNTRECTKTSAQ